MGVNFLPLHPSPLTPIPKEEHRIGNGVNFLHTLSGDYPNSCQISKGVLEGNNICICKRSTEGFQKTHSFVDLSMSAVVLLLA